MPTPEEILKVASAVANQTPEFWNKNSGVTRRYLVNLGKELNKKWPNMFRSEVFFDPAMKRCAFDFYCQDQKMAIEIALSSHGSNTEYFKDIWKAILAQREGSKAPVQQLVIIGKKPLNHKGFAKRHDEHFPRAILQYAQLKNAPPSSEFRIHLMDILQSSVSEKSA
jgi:hypothetical protein